MRTIGRYVGPGRTFDGDITVTFAIEDRKALEKLDAYKDADLVIETKKYFEKRSLSANGYFWVLVDKIARVLGSDKDTIYLWLLRESGVFVDLRVRPEAIEDLKRVYRLADAFDEVPGEDGMVDVRCYIGSSHYDTKEMAYLIDRTVEEARLLNIDTWTEDEIQQVLSVWGGRNDSKRNDT